MQDFAKRAAAVCGKDVPELTKSYSHLQAAQAPFFCLDLSFCHTVLTQGFDLSEAAPITLVKQVGHISCLLLLCGFCCFCSESLGPIHSADPRL
jgi:hypothetical protein